MASGLERGSSARGRCGVQGEGEVDGEGDSGDWGSWRLGVVDTGGGGDLGWRENPIIETSIKFWLARSLATLIGNSGVLGVLGLDLGVVRIHLCGAPANRPRTDRERQLS